MSASCELQRTSHSRTALYLTLLQEIAVLDQTVPVNISLDEFGNLMHRPAWLQFISAHSCTHGKPRHR